MERIPAAYDTNVASAASESAVAGNRVLRNTYLLLSATLAFSAVTAGAALAFDLPHPGVMLTLVGYFGLLFGVYKTRNSALGIAFVFALTGFLGYTLGPILGFYLKAVPNGHMVVVNAFAITAVTFVVLSAYAVRSRKDFSFMGGFLTVGVLAAFLLGLAAIFFDMPTVSLAVSGLFVLLMSGMILWQTSDILNGGETNYILATVTLYVSLFNLFTSLLQLLGAAGDD
jgi:modulator of FtsH protease